MDLIHTSSQVLSLKGQVTKYQIDWDDYKTELLRGMQGSRCKNMQKLAERR